MPNLKWVLFNQFSRYFQKFQSQINIRYLCFLNFWDISNLKLLIFSNIFRLGIPPQQVNNSFSTCSEIILKKNDYKIFCNSILTSVKELYYILKPPQKLNQSLKRSKTDLAHGGQICWNAMYVLGLQSKKYFILPLILYLVSSKTSQFGWY